LYGEKPRCVIVSTTFMNMEAVRKVVADVREHLPEAWIVAGGSYAHFSRLVLQRQDDEVYRHDEVRQRYFFTSDRPVDGIDCYIVDQHGERTLLAALRELLRSGRPPERLPNTIVREETGFRVHELREEEYDIETHRIRWARLPRQALATVVPFQNTYGCPFKCEFCNFSQTKVLKKPFDTLFEELEELAQHNFVQRVWFTDDNFFLNEKLVIDFCERYIELDLPFSWTTFIRASSITPRTAELIKRARGELLLMGFETGSQTILDHMNKKDTIAHYRETASQLIRCGIDLEMNLIVGFPGETRQTIDESIEFLNSLPMNPLQTNYLYLFKFNVVPLSPVFEGAQRRRWKLAGNWDRWRHATMDSDEAFAEIRRVAASSTNTVFNYLDPAGKLGKADWVELMRSRDDVAREILRSGRGSPLTAAAWDRLEASIRRQFPIQQQTA
jgi:p-methyltransferase